MLSVGSVSQVAYMPRGLMHSCLGKSVAAPEMAHMNQTEPNKYQHQIRTEGWCRMFLVSGPNEEKDFKWQALRVSTTKA